MQGFKIFTSIKFVPSQEATGVCALPKHRSKQIKRHSLHYTGNLTEDIGGRNTQGKKEKKNSPDWSSSDNSSRFVSSRK